MDRHDLPDGYIEIDFPSNRLRLTHIPSGHTALRHDFMYDGPGARKWADKLAELAAAHPGAHGIYTGSGRLVADMRDFPSLGGGFAVGDLVVTRTDEGSVVAREIVSSFPNGSPESRIPGDPAEAFRLEDGSTLYFSNGEGGWTTGGTRGERERVRRVLPTDDVEALREPAWLMLARSARRLQGDLDQNRDLHAAATWLIDEGLGGSISREGYKGVSDALHETGIALTARPTDAASYDDAVDAVHRARDFIVAVRDAHAVHRPEDVAQRAWLSRDLAFADALCEGLRRRGPLPESPEAGDDVFSPTP